MTREDKREIEVQRTYNVYKANEMIRKAKADLKIVELKAFAFALSKIEPGDDPRKWYKFTIKEYCQVFGFDEKSGNNYSRIRETFKNLRDTSYYIMNEDGTEETVGLLEKVKPSKNNGTISFRFDETMSKYIYNLGDNFFSYQLIYTLPITSKPTFLLYELLKSYAFTRTLEIDVEELKTIIDAKAEMYKDFKVFRSKILNKAIAEINKITDLEVSWEPIREGKSIAALKFHIKEKKGMDGYKALLQAKDRIDGSIEGQRSIFDILEVREEKIEE